MDATVKLRVQNRGPEPQAPPRPILMLYQTRGYVRTSTRHRISAPFFFLYPSVPARRYSLNDVVPPFPPRGHLDDHNRSEEHTSELQSLRHLVCRLLLEKK